MTESFNAHFKWLGIPISQQPPHHYRLLGIQLFESDAEVISNASDRQMTHVRSFQLGKYASASQKILNEISAARICLLDEVAKRKYDDALRAALADGKPSPLEESKEKESQAAPKAAPLPPQQLGAGAADQQESADEHAALFRAYLEGALARISGDQVNHDQEFELVEWGRKKYGLSNDASFEVLRDAAAAAGKPLASQGGGSKLVPLRGERQAWGASQPAVADAPAKQARPATSVAPAPASKPQVKIDTGAPKSASPAAPKRASNRALIVTAIVGGASVFGVLLLGLAIIAIAWFVSGEDDRTARQGGDGDGAAIRRVGPDDRSGQTRSRAPQRRMSPEQSQAIRRQVIAARPPQWADGRLGMFFHRAGMVVPVVAKDVLAVQAGDAARRGAAYRSLVEAMSHPELMGRQTIITDLLAGCHAQDPSEASVGELRAAIVASLPSKGGRPPADANECKQQFASGTLLSICIQAPRAPQQRKAQLASQAGSRLGVTLDVSRRGGMMSQVVDEAIAKRCFENLLNVMGEGPASFRQAYEAVATETERRLGTPRRDALDLDLVKSALGGRVSQWRSIEFLLETLCDSRNPQTVLAMVDVYQSARDKSLQNFLADRLMRRVSVAGVSSPAEVAAAVRAKLASGAAPAVSQSNPPPQTNPAPNNSSAPPPQRNVDPRWDTLSRTAGGALADIWATADKDEQLLQEVVNLAHAATLGCALSRGDEGRDTFDRLLADGAQRLPKPSASAVAGASSPSSAAATREFYEVAVRYVGFLTSDGASAKSQATSLRLLASHARAGRIPALQGEPAAKLADFLFTPQEGEVHDELLKALPEFVQLKYVLLAMADELEKSRTNRAHTEQLLSAALGRTVELPASSTWRDAARNELLREALAQISGKSVSPQADTDVYEKAVEALRDLYRQQAGLLGVPPPQYLSKSSPSEVLRLLIAHLASQLSSADLSQQQQQLLAETDHALSAIDYLSDNDLAQTVMLERIWLRLAAIHVAVERPDRAETAAALVERLQASDRGAAHVLVQLRDGHAKLVELWLELNRPK